jgi:DMSO/TMAO reductase YedYZ molybdopterin-dependent catalytic subunit
MKKRLVSLIAVVVVVGSIAACNVSTGLKETGGYPDFITPNDQYYITRIGSVPQIDGATYKLNVTGLVDHPRSFTLKELTDMATVELPLTVECIGNTRRGRLISTAVWKGFRLIDLLESLGLDPRATGVKYTAADGYFASHTIQQLRDNGVLVALFMNGVTIPQIQGFPVRILNPGYYGVKQPAWVTDIEVIDMPIKDYWEERGWDCEPPMPADSTIFFPDDNVKVAAGEPLTIGGAAFGGKRIKLVEVTSDGGAHWTQAEITKSMDADNVWVFWKAELTFPEAGKYVVNSRATDINGNAQEDKDPNRYDGTNDWPMLKVRVE